MRIQSPLSEYWIQKKTDSVEIGREDIVVFTGINDVLDRIFTVLCTQDRGEISSTPSNCHGAARHVMNGERLTIQSEWPVEDSEQTDFEVLKRELKNSPFTLAVTLMEDKLPVHSMVVLGADSGNGNIIIYEKLAEDGPHTITALIKKLRFRLYIPEKKMESSC